MNLKSTYYILLFGLFIFACEKKEGKDFNNTDSTAVVDSLMQDPILATEVLEQAPEWYTILPEDEEYIYAIGVAKSRRANIASEKAVMKAQVSLAEKLKELELISDTEESEQSLGADSDPADGNLSVMLQDVMIKEKKQFKSGKLWYSFVLLEMKIDK